MTERTPEQIPGLLTPAEAAAQCEIERRRRGTSVFTNGVFDLLHRGHIEYLQEARRLGHMLVVGLNTDASVRRIKGETRPLISERDRARALLALECVDFVVLFDEDTPEKLIATITPDVLVKGGDYQVEEIVGYDHVTSHGGKVVTVPLREGYSTSDLIRRIHEGGGD